MKAKLVIYRNIDQKELHELEQSFDVTYFEQVTQANRMAFLTAIQDADALLGSSVKLGEFELKNAKKLKVISTISTGIDSFDLAYLNRRQIALMHTPDVLTDTTADTMFALLMCTARRTTELNNLITSGNWQQSIGEELYGTDVHHKTLGILGMGRIAQAIAKRAHFGFDMQINYYNRSQNIFAEDTFGATRMDFERLLKNSDFVLSILPSTEQTRDLFDAKAFALMKPSAIFINGGRGDAVVEEDLIQALKTKQILAAGLDVFRQEPIDTGSALLSLPNLVMFPHIGSATTQTREAMLTCAIENIRAALKGDFSKNCANKDILNGK